MKFFEIFSNLIMNFWMYFDFFIARPIKLFLVRLQKGKKVIIYLERDRPSEIEMVLTLT